MATAWKPSESDLAWTRNIWSKLNTGGIWGYENLPITIVKETPTRARLTCQAVFPGVKEQVKRLKKIFPMVGVEVVETPQ